MNQFPTTPTKQSSAQTNFDLAELGFTTPEQMSQKMVLGFSNQRNRRNMEREESERQRGRLLKRQSMIISVPTLSSPSFSDSSAVSTPSISTPTTQSAQTFWGTTKKSSGKKPVEKKSFFNLKNASTPILNSFSRSSSPASFMLPTSSSPAPKAKAPIGLGILMGSAPSPTKDQQQTSSRMFKVGQGNSDVYFEPVQPGRRPSAFEQHLAGSSEIMDSDDDSSDDEFISFRQSYESLVDESRVAQPAGPSTLAELMQLRSSTQDIYVQARRESQAGPSRIEASPVVPAPKRLRRKAVPVLRSARKAVPPLNLEPIASAPVATRASSSSTPAIPERVQSLPPTPVLSSTPTLSAENLRSRPSGHLRNQSGESSSSSSSIPSLADGASDRTSISSSISTLRSARSETDSMPVTPQVVQFQMQSGAFFPGHDKTYELDVASVFARNSPRNNAITIVSEDDDDEDDEPTPAAKAFYQNQTATKSTWAVWTAKLKPKPATQEKTSGLRRFFNRARA